ncbi:MULTISPECIES: ImuA family protein [unclassified Bradyrhizobium]|uniref:ImuA family protein n=1 Tax=Bradyrhizobium TaxID=374 RepID=UPI0029166AE9|nr:MULTISPECIES: DNA repair protein [unclassified Bradyrhizobium]
MTGARMDTLARLRGRIARLEAGDGAHDLRRVALGHDEADATLQGGLATGALHEVFAETGRQAAAATGFLCGLAARVAARRPLIWIRQDFAEREMGALSMSGLAELGLDPRRIVIVRAPDLDHALRTAADALACDALGGVMLEVWGETQKLDLVASRKLTLAAQESGVTALMLRIAAAPEPSTAETRWIVRTAPSPLVAPWMAWGAPRLDVELIRNRHGQTGRWIMEWTPDACRFNEPAADPQPVAAAPAHRSHQKTAGTHRRSA